MKKHELPKNVSFWVDDEFYRSLVKMSLDNAQRKGRPVSMSQTIRDCLSDHMNIILENEVEIARKSARGYKFTD